VLADFADPREDGQGWRVFTDRVMGGVSTAQASIESVRGRRALRLRGAVSLDRGGGFVQVARVLGTAGRPLNASAHGGVSLRVCGAPGSYFVHLRTTQTGAPWQHYRAPLTVTADWTEPLVPWEAFEPSGLARPLDPRCLTQLGVVAGRAAFAADVAVARVGFDGVTAPPPRSGSDTTAPAAAGRTGTPPP
jgi:hypothetical protein